MNAECGKKNATLLFPPSQFRIHNSMLATPYSFRKQLLPVLFGLIALTSMTADAPAECQLQKLLAADGAANDRFGTSVAVSGNTAVIGAPFDDDLGSSSGAAYLFERVGGVWTQVAKLTATDGAAGDNFGGSVAVSGDTAVIGAPFGDGQEFASGAAYVFEKIDGIWTQTAELAASDGVFGDRFGGSVAVSGDTAVVGDEENDDLGSNSGSAYVFEKVGGVWTQVAKLTADDGAAGDMFGGSVAVSGDTAVIGARLNLGNLTDSGSAYVFEKAAGVWTQTGKLTPTDGASNDQFGFSVALSGDTVVIGANLDDDACPGSFWGCSSGSAYVFENIAGVWTQTAKLTAADGVSYDQFGFSVALSGAEGDQGGTPKAVIGANLDDALGSDSGSAYVFEKVAAVWTQTAKLNASDGAAADEFGSSVAVSGDTAVIGGRLNDAHGANSGSAYVFLLAGLDCNHNGIPDECEEDCNNNGVSDECDVDPADPDGNDLVSPDCNGNGVPDECDLVSSMDFVHQSGEFSPFQSGANATEVIPAPPAASGDVTLTVEVKADFDQVSEFVDVFLNGMPVGRLFESDGVQCPATFDMGSLIIAEAMFNALLPGNLTVHLVPSADVDACTGVVKLRLSYSGGSNNCNGNSIPDDCETDGDGDGVIDVCDPCPLDNPDDTDGDGVCDADDFCLDTPLGLLVDLDGCTRRQGPCCFPGAVCIDETDRESCEAFPGGTFQGDGLTCGDPDGDGVAGCVDGCPLDPAKADPGVCGCGVPDDDGDLDGIADCKDHCSQTPSGVPVNVCGCAEVGACCAAGGACFDNIERTLCVTITGIYQGDGSVCAEGCAFGDLDGDGDADLVDFGVFTRCFTGAGGEAGPACSEADVDGCGPIDLEDFEAFPAALTGP